MYRKGWTLSTANPALNILAARTLFFIGAFFLHGRVPPKNAAGLILGAAGILLMNKI